ncbi:hypothetical protein LTR01_006554 [Friedmanniomyces endolithicus]|nr:hypothetical protein LTR01_006554 [Friedmanniomyces endolithicus]KAK0830765.1 hypothetical protein LTR73_003151 [Friedmanniomyces endolithicus]
MTGSAHLIGRLKRHLRTARSACFDFTISPASDPSQIHAETPDAGREATSEQNTLDTGYVSIVSGNNGHDDSHALNTDYTPVSTQDDGSEDLLLVKMGKSNKFDYSKKKNTGVGLGHFIAKQLESEAEAVKKSAGRQAKKQSTSSASSLDGLESDSTVIHHIDLKVPGKELGDEGLFVLADGVELALKKGNAEASLALEDVDLTANGLTTASLARLASVVEMASFDVKTINLANNNIVVVSDEQAAEWEMFLRSFKDCQKLRRLDLSGNAGLGTRAIEELARIHIAEPQVDPIRLTSGMSVYSLHSTHGHGDGIRTDGLSLEPMAPPDLPCKLISDGRTLTRRCGLRSLPYLNLSDVGLTGTGALWLSYVLEDHYYPEQLLNELNATLATTTIEAYRQGQQMHGIDWSQNEGSLSKDGFMLLTKAESVRRRTVVDNSSILAGSVAMDDFTELVGGADPAAKRSAERRDSRLLAGNRRTSLKSVSTEDGGEQGVAELDRLRKRIQRQIIAHDKPSSVHLWHASLRLLRCARLLLIASPSSRKYSTGLAPIQRPSTPRDQPTLITQPPPPFRKTANGKEKVLAVDTAKAALATPRKSYAKLLSPSGRTLEQPEQAITETNTPKRVFKAHRKDAFSDAADPVAVSERLSGLVLRQSTAFEQYIEYQQRRIDESEKGFKAFRDVEVACHLPSRLVERIVGFVLPRRELELMTEGQRSAVVQWGLKRETLRVGWVGKDESSQAWMLLDGIKCLEYGQ